jgi:hypothetical protein
VRNGDKVVVQCQGGINHDGHHFFTEDHYTVQWSDRTSNASAVNQQS